MTGAPCPVCGERARPCCQVSRAEHEALSERLAEVEQNRVSVHVHQGQGAPQGRFSSLPPQVRKHAPTALVVAVVTTLFELGRAWVR